MPKIDINEKRGDPEARVDLERFWEDFGDLKSSNHVVAPLDWSQSIDKSYFTKFPEESDFIVPIGRIENTKNAWLSYDLSIVKNLLAALKRILQGSLLSLLRSV